MFNDSDIQQFLMGKLIYFCTNKESLEKLSGIMRENTNMVGRDAKFIPGGTCVKITGEGLIISGILSDFKNVFPYVKIVTVPKEEPEETLVTFAAPGQLSHHTFTSTKKCKVTKHTNGYTVEIIPEPKFSIGETFIISSGKLGKVIDSPEYTNGKYTYEIQWTDGKKNKCQPEDSMIKLEEAFK